MKKNTHYVLVTMTGKESLVFDNVRKAAEWLVDNEDVASFNAARTGVYYVLEGRMKHYKHIYFVAMHV